MSRSRSCPPVFGAGETKRYPTELDIRDAQFLTNDRVILIGRAAGQRLRAYVMNLSDGKPQPITPESFVPTQDTAGGPTLIVSPDGGRIIIKDGSGMNIYSPAGEKIAPVPGVDPDDIPLRWASDGKTIFIVNDEKSNGTIIKLDIATGRRTTFREITPTDTAGFAGKRRTVITPDGNAYAYVGFRLMSTSIWSTG